MSLPNVPRLSDAPGGGIWNVIKNTQSDVNALNRQAIDNEFARPMAEANLQGVQLKNKFLPLDMGIRAQNAMVHANRFGEVGQYLRSVAQMPASEKSLYFADPKNWDFHTQMMEEFKQGVNNPQNSNQNILTPEFLGAFGLGQPTNALSQGAGGREPLANNPLLTMPGEEEVSPVNPLSRRGLVPPPSQRLINAEDAKKLLGQPGFTSGEEQGDKRQDTLARQAGVNKKLASRQMNQRANNALVIDDWLMSNRDKISHAFVNASKYSGLINQGKKGLDMLLNRDPKAYEDYVYANTAIIPHLVSQIKAMENLGATDSQREEMRGLVNALNKWSLRPKEALQTLNKQIGTLMDISDSVFNAAEPRFKGVFREQAKLPKLEGDYISPDLIEQSANKAATAKGNTGTKDWIFTLPKGEIAVINKNGIQGSIPESQWAKAEKAGYKRIR